MPDQSSAATEHAILQEITRPLESLPDDPLSVVNAEFPTSLRGYDRIAVDDYVRHTRQLVAELQATRSPEAAVRRALERVGEEITGILQRAHETAEQITAQSRREAEDRLEQVRAEARQIADAAEQRVRDLDADTDRIWLERQRIVADAEDLASQLHGLARGAAERFPADVEDNAPEASPEPVIGAVEPAVATPEPEEDVGEVTAETAEHAGFGDVTVDTADQNYLGDSDAEFFEPVAPRPQSEIERTMAFEPLGEVPTADPGASAAETGASAEPAEPIPAPAPVPSPEPELDPDATTIIPPSSRAAHRRSGE